MPEFITALAVSLVVAAASLALSELLRPKPKFEDAKPANLSDFKFPTAIEGRVIPILWGRVKISGPNVVWYGDFRQRPITTSVKTSMFSSKRITTGYRYSVGIQLAICSGELDAYRRLWVGEKEVWSGTVTDGSIVVNEPDLFGGTKLGSGGMIGTFRTRVGSATQATVSYLGDHQTPLIPYRHTAYLVWEGGEIGTQARLEKFEFEVERYPNALGLTGGKEIVNTADANPACVIYEYLTNEDWGLGFPASDVNIGNLIAQGETLYDEGNGYGFILDRPTEGFDFLAEIERQIDGKVIFDMNLGLWTLLLVRGGYNIDTVPQLTTANVLKVDKYDEGTWEDTTGDYRVEFSDRNLDYFDTSARQDDLANIRIQGRLVSTSQKFPGVKDATLANKLAARGLMALSVPLKTATLIVDRSLYSLRVSDVVAWTDADFSLTKLPMRVLSIDLGFLDDGKIALQLQQDVYGFQSEISAAPPGTSWTPSTQGVAAIPVDEQVVIEAPYALCRRDTELDGLQLDRLWCGGRQQTGAEATIKIYERNAVGTPSGAYSEAGEIFGFLYVGDLRTALAVEDGAPGSAVIEIDPDPDTLSLLEAAFTANPATADLGQNLINLCYIDGEWFAPRTVVNQTTYLQLTGGYRGLLDSRPKAHAINTPIFLAFSGGNLSNTTIPQTNNVDAQLRPLSRSAELAEGSATTIALTMDNRARRAIVPSELEINATRFDTTPDPDDLKSGGSTLDERGLEFDFNRRDYRTLDEVQGLANDAADIAGDFPAANTHQNRLILVESEATLLTDLQASYGLNESSGNRSDSGPNSYTLTDINTVTTATAKLGANAAQFTRVNSERLVAASGSVLNYGDEDFSFAGWVYLDSVTGDSSSFWTKLNADVTDDRQYACLFNLAANRFRWSISSDGTAGNTTTVDANQLGAPSTATWYFIYCDYSASLDRMRIRVNNGIYDVASHSGGAHQTTNATFALGSLQGGGGTWALFHNGRIDAVHTWGRILSESEQSLLYNGSGTALGQEYPFSHLRTFLTEGWSAFKNAFISRTELIELAGGSLPDGELDVTVEARHDYETTTYEAAETLALTLTLDTSDLDSLTPMGVLPSSTASQAHTALTTATYNFEIGTALGANVQARINGGGWSTVITSPATTGTLAGVTAGDTIEVQHLDASAPPDRTLLLVKDGAGTPVPEAYAVLVPS